MEYQKAYEIATRVKALLAPHCERIEIAGSIRRKKAEVKDIEIVAIPKPWGTGLFLDGVAAIVNDWEKVKGDVENNPSCKYTQRILPEGIKLDLFFAVRENWGLIYALRTGSADYSHKVLAHGWTIRGYHSVNGMLTNRGKIYPVYEEIELFNKIGVEYVEPEYRNFPFVAPVRPAIHDKPTGEELSRLLNWSYE